MNKTIEQLLEDGARVDINFHHAVTEEEAKEKLKPYTELGEISDLITHKGSRWVQIKTKNFDLSISSFLEKGE